MSDIYIIIGAIVNRMEMKFSLSALTNFVFRSLQNVNENKLTAKLLAQSETQSLDRHKQSKHKQKQACKLSEANSQVCGTNNRHKTKIALKSLIKSN